MNVGDNPGVMIDMDSKTLTLLNDGIRLKHSCYLPK